MVALHCTNGLHGKHHAEWLLLHLDDMRKRLPKMRVYSNSFSSSGSVPEYKYINYDLEVIRQEYDRISNTIMEMQIALDRYNQTVLFDVDI